MFILASIAAFFMFAPEDRVNSVKLAFSRMTQNKGQLCLDAFSRELRSPTSAKLMDYNVINNKVYINYTAKNSFGTELKGRTSCPIRNGKINKTQMLIDSIDRMLPK